MHKKIPLLTIVLAATVLSSDSLGQEGPNKDRRRGPATLFERFDVNQDGKITNDELPERAMERLTKADSDGDGSITRDELKSHFQERRRGGGSKWGRQTREKSQEPDTPKRRPDPAKIFERLDSNKDKSLSLEEFTEGMKRRHQHAYRHRGKPQGQHKGMDQRRGPGSRYRKPQKKQRGYIALKLFDQNRDGSISNEEIETFTVRLKKLDGNSDGKISAEELTGHSWKKLTPEQD